MPFLFVVAPCPLVVTMLLDSRRKPRSGFHSNAGSLGGDLALGSTDIGAPSQEVGGNADGDLAGRRRNGTCLGHDLVHFARRTTQQDAEAIQGLLVGDFQAGNGRGGALHVRPRLRHVQLGGQFRLESLLGQS